MDYFEDNTMLWEKVKDQNLIIPKFKN